MCSDHTCWKQRPIIGLFLGIVLVVAFGSCRKPGSQQQRLVLITVDTLRYDSLFGSAEQPSIMPLTGARASRCLVFDQFFAATSTTQPTHATLLTALHPWQHGVMRNGTVLAEEHTTLAQRLQEAGFRTAAVTASVPVSQRFGFAKGFDEFHDEFSHILQPGAEGPIGEKYYSLAGSVTQKALEILDRIADAELQFLWLHYFDPHAPYGDSRDGPILRPMEVVKSIVDGQVDRESGIRRARQLYEQDVSYLDRSLEVLFRRLTQDDGRIETHLLLTADHGESFGEDDSMAHGRRLTAGQIHVPTFLCSPRVEAGVRSEVAGSIDVTPTLLSLAGIPLDSSSARDLTRSPRGLPRAYGMKTTRPYQELRLDGRTYDLSFNLFYMIDHDGRLYRGNGDRLLESASERKVNGQLKALFGSFEAQLADSGAEELQDPETLRALRALGYLH